MTTIIGGYFWSNLFLGFMEEKTLTLIILTLTLLLTPLIALMPGKSRWQRLKNVLLCATIICAIFSFFIYFPEPYFQSGPFLLSFGLLFVFQGIFIFGASLLSFFSIELVRETRAKEPDEKSEEK